MKTLAKTKYVRRRIDEAAPTSRNWISTTFRRRCVFAQRNTESRVCKLHVLRVLRDKLDHKKKTVGSHPQGRVTWYVIMFETRISTSS